MNRVLSRNSASYVEKVFLQGVFFKHKRNHKFIILFSYQHFILLSHSILFLMNTTSIEEYVVLDFS